MRRTLPLLISLIVFWLLLSGMFEPFLLAACVGSAVAVVLFYRRMNALDGETADDPLAWLRFLGYCPWLIKEIILSAWSVTRLILHPRLPITPTLVEFTPSQSTDAGLVIHANSITLTPGTISVEAAHGRFLVHALSHENGASLAESEMDRRCTELEVR